VALGWWAVRRGDRARAAALCEVLEASSRSLQQRGGTLRCRRRNRENHLKRLVSTWTVLAHLWLMLDRCDRLPPLAEAVHALLHRLGPGRPPADVMLRMSSNLARCLVLQGPNDPERLLADLTLLHDELMGEGDAASAPQEDHRRYVAELREGVRAWLAGEGPPDGPPDGARAAGPPPFAVAALNVDTPLVRRGLRQHWS
jgi:hypothetical protein